MRMYRGVTAATLLAALLAVCVSEAVAPVKQREAAASKAVRIDSPLMIESSTRKVLPKLATTSRQSMGEVDAMGRRSCELVNRERAQYGLYALYYSGSLTSQSYSHSSWMAQYNSFTHQDVGSIWFYITDTRYNAQMVLSGSGENIAMSMHRSNDVALDFHWQWVTSPPHYANMLGQSHTHCGSGFYYDGRHWWGTQLFGQGQFGNEMNGLTGA